MKLIIVNFVATLMILVGYKPLYAEDIDNTKLSLEHMTCITNQDNTNKVSKIPEAEKIVRDYFKTILLEMNPLAAHRAYFNLSPLDSVDRAFLVGEATSENISPKIESLGEDIVARYMADQWLTNLGSFYLGLGKESVNVAKGENLEIMAFDDFDVIVKESLKKHPNIAKEFETELDERNLTSKRTFVKHLEIREKVNADILKNILLKVSQKSVYHTNVEAMLNTYFHETTKKVFRGKTYYRVHTNPLIISFLTEKRGRLKIISSFPSL